MTGLEALEEFKGNNNTKLVGRAMGKQHYLDCLQVMEKYLKALEIIIENNVDVNEIRPNAKAKDYNSKMPYYRRNLTEEEFKLLKEVLE